MPLTFIYFRRGFIPCFNLLASKIMSLREATMQFGGVFLGDGTRCAPQQPEVLVDNRLQAICTPVVGGITTIEIAYDSKG